VVKQDQTVEMRPVDIDRGNDKETVVRSGVKPGETVVTDGQVRLVPGIRIEVANKPAAASGQTVASQGSGS
jgi:multidrug efflux system membrane fusion protein